MQDIRDHIEQNMHQMKRVTRVFGYRFRCDPDDLLQDCLVRVWRFHAQLVDVSDKGFMRWFYTIARSVCLDGERKKKTSIDTDPIEYAWSSNVSPNQLTMRPELSRIYWIIRREFCSRDSIIIYLIAQGYQYDEIAEIMQMNLGTIKNIIHRVRKFLIESKIPAI